MIAAFAQARHLEEARGLFDKMPGRTLVSWNAMIAGCVQNGCDGDAVDLFHRMDHRYTITSVADAYGNLGDVPRGKLTHERAVASGDDWDVIVQTALIIMYGLFGMANEAEAVYGAVAPGGSSAYSQSGAVNHAKEMFDRSATRDVVVWTTMLTAFAQNGDIDQARQVD